MSLFQLETDASICLVDPIITCRFFNACSINSNGKSIARATSNPYIVEPFPGLNDRSYTNFLLTGSYSTCKCHIFTDNFSVSIIFGIPCRCVANINLAFFADNHCIPLATNDCAEIDSVPAHNSSPNTSVCSFAFLKISLNSDISTAKEDSPANKLS